MVSEVFVSIIIILGFSTAIYSAFFLMAVDEYQRPFVYMPIVSYGYVILAGAFCALLITFGVIASR